MSKSKNIKMNKTIMELLNTFAEYANNEIGVDFESMLEENEMVMEDLVKGFMTKNNALCAKLTPKEKGEKKKKDPNAPKRPKSAFFFFSSDKRDKVRKDNPEMKITEISSELGKMWKSLSEKAKKKYEELAKTDKDRYTSEMEDYEPSEEYKKPEKKKGKKRAPSAYILFSNDHRSDVKEENPDLNNKEIVSKLAEMWNSADKKTKDKYEKKAKDAKEKLKASQDEAECEDEEEEKPSKSKKGKSKKEDKPKKEKKDKKKEEDSSTKSKSKKGKKQKDEEPEDVEEDVEEEEYEEEPEVEEEEEVEEEVEEEDDIEDDE